MIILCFWPIQDDGKGRGKKGGDDDDDGGKKGRGKKGGNKKPTPAPTPEPTPEPPMFDVRTERHVATPKRAMLSS